MIRAYQFRIYPKKKQEVILNRTLTTCRHLYNNALAERKRQADLNRLKKQFDVFPWGKPEWIYYEDQANDLSGSKTDFQKGVHSQVLQNVLKRVDKSMDNYFAGSGYPRFKGRNRYNSFTYPQSGFELKDGKLTLSKIGTFKVTLSNGEQVKPPKFLRESEDKLIHEQKRLSRKKLRSKNRKKQIIVVANKEHGTEPLCCQIH